MKFKTIAAAALIATAGSAFATGGALGTIDNMTVPVFSLASGPFFQDFFTFDIADPGTVYGEVLSSGISPFVVTLVSGITTIASDTSPESFSFGGLSAGSYTLTFLGFPTSSVGGYGGFVATTTAPIPEPETYAMTLAGLGAIGFMAARRRRQG